VSDVDVPTVFETISLLLVGYGVGNLSGRRHRKTARPAGPKYTCGCTHDLSVHDPKTGRCHAGVKRLKYDYVGDVVGYIYPQCPCKQYVGPKPPPDLKDLWPEAPGVGD